MQRRRGATSVLEAGLAALVAFGVVTLLAHAAGRALAARGIDPYPHAWHGYEMYPPATALIGFAIAGAVGAAAAKRGGASIVPRLAAALFPTLLIVMLLLLMDRALTAAGSQVYLGWVVGSFVAAIAGCAPFLTMRPRGD